MNRPPRFVALSLAALLVVAGVLGALAVYSLGEETPGSLERAWLSDTGRDIEGNHHAVAAGRVGGQPWVFAPLSGHAHSSETADDGHQHSHARGCALTGLDGATGEVRWRNPVPENACTIHAVADPILADADDDGAPEVVAATTEERVAVYDPTTGAVTRSVRLSAYGFTPPLVDDLVAGESGGRAGNEIAVVDVRGLAVVIGDDGAVLWKHRLGSDVQAQPHAADLDDDPQRELVVGTVGGNVVALEPAEGVRWNRSLGDVSVTWLTTGQADDDAASEVVATTYEGDVVLLDDDGTVQWRRDVGRLAAAEAFVDGDGDGVAEVYATNRTGTVTAFGADGRVEWTRDVVDEDVQMTPPPVLGDLDGDGAPELVVADNAGGVTVLDPATGEVLATHDRDVSVWTHPTLADLDGDGGAEVLVVYGDGRVARLDYEGPP